MIHGRLHIVSLFKSQSPLYGVVQLHKNTRTEEEMCEVMSSHCKPSDFPEISSEFTEVRRQVSWHSFSGSLACFEAVMSMSHHVCPCSSFIVDGFSLFTQWQTTQMIYSMSVKRSFATAPVNPAKNRRAKQTPAPRRLPKMRTNRKGCQLFSRSYCKLFVFFHMLGRTA